MNTNLSWLPNCDPIFVPAKPKKELVVATSTLRAIGKESDGSVWECVKRGLEEGLLTGSDTNEPDNLFIVASDSSDVSSYGDVGWITLAISKQD